MRIKTQSRDERTTLNRVPPQTLVDIISTDVEMVAVEATEMEMVAEGQPDTMRQKNCALRELFLIHLDDIEVK